MDRYVPLIDTNKRRVYVARFSMDRNELDVVLWMAENPYYPGSYSALKHTAEMTSLADICARALTKSQPAREIYLEAEGAAV